MLNSLKIFLFDNGVALHKPEQTEDKLHQLAIHLIEYKHCDVPENMKVWYNNHRTFDMNGVCNDMLNEIIGYMHLEALENFCKTNKKYHAHRASLLTNSILQEHRMYLLEVPDTYNEWIDVYNRSKIAAYKTDQLFSLLNYEKEQGYYTKWLFLFTNYKNNEIYDLTTYTTYEIDKIIKRNSENYDFFNLKLNMESHTIKYAYIINNEKVKEVLIDVDVYDTIYRYYYFYSFYALFDSDELFIELEYLLEDMPTMKPKLLEKAHQRLQYLQNY